MLEQLIIGVLSAFCGAIGTYAVLKIVIKPQEMVYNILNFILEEEQMQKKIFLLGALLGNGIKSGIGINPRSGKMKFEDLLAMALSQFFIKGEQQQTEGIPTNPLDVLKRRT